MCSFCEFNTLEMNRFQCVMYNLLHSYHSIIFASDQYYKLKHFLRDFSKVVFDNILTVDVIERIVGCFCYRCK